MMVQFVGQIQISFKVVALLLSSSLACHHVVLHFVADFFPSPHTLSKSLYLNTLYSGCSVRQKMILSVCRNLQIFLFHLSSNLSHLFQLQFTVIKLSQSWLSTLSFWTLVSTKASFQFWTPKKAQNRVSIPPPLIK